MVVIVVAAMVKVVAEIIVAVPTLVSSVPPPMKSLVTVFALFPQVFHALSRFVAVLSVVGDRSIELGLRFLRIVPALFQLIVRTNARSAHHEHPSSDYRAHNH
jgi:hypothetical protein